MKCRLLLLALLSAAPEGGAGEDEAIAALLASSEPEKREEGIRELGKTQNTATAKRLIKLLEDPDWGVQMEAVRALAPIAFEPGRDALEKVIFHGATIALRTLAAEKLGEFDAKRSAASLANAVFRTKDEERLPGIRALGVIGTEEAVRALEKLARTHEEDQRAEACHALGLLRAGEKELTRCLKDKEPVVQVRAALALARIDSDSAREELLEFLERAETEYVLLRAGRAGSETNREAWHRALALRLEGTKSPLPLLRVAVGAGVTGAAAATQPLLRHRDPLVQAFAARLLGLADPPPPDGALVDLLGAKDSRVRYAAAEALMRIHRAEPVAMLRQLLKHPQAEVATRAVRETLDRRLRELAPELLALARGEGPGGRKAWQMRAPACVAAGWVGGMAAFDDLVKISGERDWTLAAAALEGLFRIYDKRVIPILVAQFDARHPVVRLAARKNLRFMTQKKFATKRLFEQWWEEHGPTIELIHPEDAGERMRKDGYHVRRDMLEVLRNTDIVAVKGRWDRVELILEDLKIEHAALRAQTVKENGLNPKQIVLVNCEGSADSETSMMLQWFVLTGGYMATTDWAVVNALRNTFPDIVVKYGRQSTGNDVVIAEEAAAGHPVLQEVFQPYVAPKWWLEIAAFPLEVSDPVRATVLVDSLQMFGRYGRSSLMVVFDAGLGRVMHSVSHFFLQTEGLAKETGALRRRIFAHDHLGMSMPEIRDLDRRNYFDDTKDTVPISKSYSMFHMLVNFLEEKRKIDLGK